MKYDSPSVIEISGDFLCHSLSFFIYSYHYLKLPSLQLCRERTVAQSVFKFSYLEKRLRLQRQQHPSARKKTHPSFQFLFSLSLSPSPCSDNFLSNKPMLFIHSYPPNSMCFWKKQKNLFCQLVTF